MQYSKEFIGEALGTFVLVLLGCGSEALTMLFGTYQGIIIIALIWGFSYAFAIYLTRNLSSTHLNPAVSVAMVIGKRMSVRKLPLYLVAQFTGAFIAGLVLYSLLSPSISIYENAHAIIRGSAESIQTAKLFGEYYSIPGNPAVVTMSLAIGAEAFGTFILLLMIFAITEGSNLGHAKTTVSPLVIGLSLASIYCLISPLTQAGLNPARDFGPRMVSWMFGWGPAAFPDQAGGFLFVYIIGPILGGVLAALFFENILKNRVRVH
jgi:glycerol uptake facilitator protein